MARKEIQKPKMKFFISYCASDGLNFAANAAVALETNGHRAWYFARDKTPGITRIEEISTKIRSWCNIVLYLCTDGSISSDGQSKEISQWDNSGKQLIIIPIDRAIVPTSIDTYNYQRMSTHGFVAELNTFIKDHLEEHVKNYEEWNHRIEVRST